ncbi:MAG: ribonuclease H-like domain-containing protein, partial [Candidatus Limnocylindrales bacterium]
MTTPVADGPSPDLARRLERFRAAVRVAPGNETDPLPHAPIPTADLAARLASTLDGEVVTARGGRFVRVEGRSVDIPVDRPRLAGLPGQPPADRPLVCLDTETTGLATAAGTVAFLIGLGWWEGDRFRQVQLLLPDHAEEGALLDELARHVPPDAWLVTYNGRGFDWPLLVARYRMARRAAPAHDGHLDLLPIVRRLFRHRMDDARLQTVERSLLGVERHDDVDGWEIPGRYLGFLRGGPAEPLAAVVRHNDEDVRSLARLIALLDNGYTSSEARRTAPIGDVAGLARAFVRARRPEEALACLDEVLERADAPAAAAVEVPRPVVAVTPP